MPDPVSATRDALDLRTLGRQARRAQLSGNALLAVALSVAVLTAALLLWAGIVTGVPRVALLLCCTIFMPLRLLAHRLSAVTLSDGVTGATNSALRRWLSHWEAAGLMLAAGLNAFGSHHDSGPVFGLVAGGLLIAAGMTSRGRAPFLHGRIYPTLILAFTCFVAVFEPLWGWRGQTLLVGLSVIGLVLIGQILRPAPRQAAAAPSGSEASETDGA